MYSASADTVTCLSLNIYSDDVESFLQTMTTVSHFLLAMMSHPESLAKAQQEIDSVVGADRLPTFSDRGSLPYSTASPLRGCHWPCTYMFSAVVEAVLNETWRWGVPVPLSETLPLSSCLVEIDLTSVDLPHRLMEDDTYRNMHIPKGSMVSSNHAHPPVHALKCRCSFVGIRQYMVHISLMFRHPRLNFVFRRAILRDERIYSNPSAFYPERFLEKVDTATERRRNPRNYVFGFGRRCVGMKSRPYLPETYTLVENALVPTSLNRPSGF